MNDIAIKLTDVSKTYRLYERNVVDRFKDTFLPGRNKYHKKFEALKNINLEIKKGDILGIIGRNGAGKSTLLKIISGITQPTSGSVEVNGRVVPLLELGGGLNPEYTGRENIYFYCSLQGMTKREIDALYPEIVSFAELDDFIDVPVKKYSSGMKGRLNFAVSVNIDPDILILDEVLSVGDEMFRKKCFTRMQDLFTSKKTIVYVSHSLGSVKQFCTRTVLLHKGDVLLKGHPELVINNYQRLLNSQGEKEREKKLIENIKSLDSNENQKKERESDILNRNLKERMHSDFDVKTKDIIEPFYVDNFESKGKKAVKSKKISIKDGVLTTPDGKPVNHILWSERYKLTFKADFEEDAENVRLGFIIYDHRNNDISGIIYPGPYNPIPHVAAGERRTAETVFSAFLPDGLYAVRFVVRARSESQEESVSVLTDAVVFRCIGLVRDIGSAQLFHTCLVS